ncbi:MAG: lipocalin family protein [Phaeodactylibacter sp.]|nr:lipocalin family protein [Phaeodactylibacter sp.]MCB9294348.1 lipocalin family protein [Lewinellaceae bacterium]MCO6487925.1 lipocalin family protein [Phaeodactylibacter sp.]
MKRSSLLTPVLLLSVVLMGSSCGSEPENQQELLVGRWELTEATRNGSPTESLSDLYFVFRADGTMNTNLPVPGLKEENKYKLEGRNLYQYSDEMPDELAYYINEIGDSTLVLNTELRNFRFSFVLKRQPEKEQLQ